jgi:CheY-like chemotaxis protein
MIAILIAEDQVIVREAIASLLDLDDDFEVVAQVGRGDEVLGAARAAAPDVALLDIEMPGASGLQVLSELVAALPPATCVARCPAERPGSCSRTPPRPSCRRRSGARWRASGSSIPVAGHDAQPSFDDHGQARGQLTNRSAAHRGGQGLDVGPRAVQRVQSAGSGTDVPSPDIPSPGGGFALHHA